MISGPPFPISIAELDNSTLTQALGTTVVGFKSTRIGEDRGMLGEIFVITPEYVTPGTGPQTVIAKFAALREGALASARRGNANERELRCYDELLDGIAVSTPHFYRGWYDPDTAHFLLVQATIEADTSVDQVTGIPAELAQLVAGEAAKLHHQYWDNPALADLAWLPRLDDDRRIHNLTTIAENGWQPLCELLGDEIDAVERQLGAEFPQRLTAVLHELSSMTSTLIHCDLRADNLLFATDRDAVSLIDWQGAGTGPGSFDIAYLLSHSLSVEDRRSHETALIDAYLDDLAAEGTDLDRAEFMAGYQAALHYGLVIACAMPLIGDASQPRVKALASVQARRSIEALRDHDLLWQ